MSVSFGPRGEQKGRFLVVPEDLGNVPEEDLDELHRPLRNGRKTGRFEVHREDPWEEPYPVLTVIEEHTNANKLIHSCSFYNLNNCLR